MTKPKTDEPRISGGTAAGKLLNPIATINRDVYDKTFAEAANLSIAKLDERIAEKQDVLAKAYEEAGPDFDLAKVETLKGDTPTVTLGNMVDANSASGALVEVRAQKAAIEETARRKAIADTVDPEAEDRREPLVHARIPQRSLGQGISAALRERGMTWEGWGSQAQAGGGGGMNIEAAVMTRSAGYEPRDPRSGLVVDLPREPLTLLEYLPRMMVEAPRSSFRYMRESGGSVTDDGGAAVSENSDLDEETYTWSEASHDIESIGARIPVTVEQLADIDAMEGIVTGRLEAAVRMAIEAQLMNGNGTSPQINGFLSYVDASGGTPAADEFNQIEIAEASNRTDALLGKTVLTQIRKAQTEIRTKGATFADAVVMHPRIRELINLSETTSAGFYMGDPRFVPAEMIWGLRILESQHGLKLTAQADADSSTSGSQPSIIKAGDNLAVVGAFRSQSMVIFRKDVGVEMGLNNTDFQRRRISFRSYGRVCLAVFRIKGFCDLTVV